ncbi:hypothetical protein QCA50_020268 [Cerrena zonata]|uniref:Uncharacterized protein n=1 Tax=Cerrena zonata TaxID=2478898 RepID=A0AAW0F812_9APHY
MESKDMPSNLADNVSLKPITPLELMQQVQEQSQTVNSRLSIGSRLPPGPRRTVVHSLSHTLPDKWEAKAHPDGKTFYRCTDDMKRILTYVDIRDPAQENCTELLESACQKLRERLGNDSSKYYYILNFQQSPDGVLEVGYYIDTDEVHESVVWADSMELCRITTDEFQAQCDEHFDYAMRYQYWTHFQLFPIAQRFSRADIIQFLNRGWAELTMSGTLILGYTNELIEEMEEILRNIQDKEIRSNAQEVAIARILSALYWQRFIGFNSTVTPSTNRARSEKSRKQRFYSWWFRLLSPFLFWMPYVYLSDLREIWKDDGLTPTVNIKLWNEFITQLGNDWDGSTTPATVLLSANVGFLAIQSIDQATTTNKSAAQIASYVSALLSLFAYIAFQILCRRHRPLTGNLGNRHSAQMNMINYLCNHMNLLGLETLALAFSVPIACFIWSMMTFLLAISFVFFFKTSLVTRITVGAVYAFLMIICGMLLYMSWGSRSSRQEQPMVTNPNGVKSPGGTLNPAGYFDWGGIATSIPMIRKASKNASTNFSVSTSV